jgi:hypothetical protein
MLEMCGGCVVLVRRRQVLWCERANAAPPCRLEFDEHCVQDVLRCCCSERFRCRPFLSARPFTRILIRDLRLRFSLALSPLNNDMEPPQLMTLSARRPGLNRSGKQHSPAVWFSRFFYSQAVSTQERAVNGYNRIARFPVVWHMDNRKTARMTRAGILHQGDTLHCSVQLKQSVNVSLGGAES